MLYQKRYWNHGYAQKLRNNWYMKIMIPKDTLHRDLHEKIHDVPVPNEEDCRIALIVLRELSIRGVISDNDPAWVRLDTLIEIWKGTNPTTIEVLKWQRDVIFKFFTKRD